MCILCDPPWEVGVWQNNSIPRLFTDYSDLSSDQSRKIRTISHQRAETWRPGEHDNSPSVVPTPAPCLLMNAYECGFWWPLWPLWRGEEKMIAPDHISLIWLCLSLLTRHRGRPPVRPAHPGGAELNWYLNYQETLGSLGLSWLLGRETQTTSNIKMRRLEDDPSHFQNRAVSGFLLRCKFYKTWEKHLK